MLALAFGKCSFFIFFHAIFLLFPTYCIIFAQQHGTHFEAPFRMKFCTVWLFMLLLLFFLFSTLHLRERLTNNDLKNINNEPGERERNRKGLLQSLFRFQVEYSLIQTAFVCILAFIFAGVFNFKWHKQSRGF